MEKKIAWPLDIVAANKLTKWMFGIQKSTDTRHVMLVRGSRFIAGEKGRDILFGLIRDWLSARWPIVVYVKGSKSPVIGELGPIFISVGPRTSSSSFPMCSCAITLGVHQKGRVFTNPTGLQHIFTKCGDADNSRTKKGTFRDWNPVAAENIIKRIFRAYSPCYVVKNLRHLCADAFNLSVSSATKEEVVGSTTNPPPRPLGIVQECFLNLHNTGLGEDHPVREETCSRPAAGVLAQLAVPGPDGEHRGSSRCLGKGGQGGGGSGGETADIRGKAPNQKKVVFVDEAYPTEQDVKQKREREAREEKLAEEGLTKEEIEALRKRKKSHQEIHYDDCGSDLGPLEEKPLTHALACHDTFNSAIAYSYFDHNAYGSDSASSSEEDAAGILADNYSLHYLVGSAGSGGRVNPPGSTHVPIEELNSYLVKPEVSGTVDIVEIFGGESGVGKLCLRRRLRRGVNFDLVIGFDLTKESHQKEVERYIADHKPLVVVLGPPCTSFGHWSHLNQYRYPDTWLKSRWVGETLAKFAARVCWIQLRANRHFLVENPAGSELFHLDCFEQLWTSGRVVKCRVPQCALGLMIDGMPIYKNTTLFASSSLLLAPFKGLACTSAAHGTLSGRCGNVDKTKLAQVWPREMCHRICIGIQALMRQRRRAYLLHDADMFYLTGRGRPRKNPLGIVSADGVIYDCPACMQRLHKRHPAHTRNGEPPLLCKHYNIAPENWLCPACLAVKPRDDPAHAEDEGCRYGSGGVEVYRRVKKQFGVRAKAGPVRDPAIPAAGEADRDPIIDNLDLDADVGAVSAPGVISTPVPDAIRAPDEVVTEEETLGIMRGDARAVTKEEGGDTPQDTNLPDLVDITGGEEDNDGFIDRRSPITVREQRIAKARRVLGLKEQEDRGDQADQAAAEDHRTTYVTKVLQLLRSSDEATIRKTLQRLHVKWYHCETERLM